jgi:xylan 1,4-beta-xylosidase
MIGDARQDWQARIGERGRTGTRAAPPRLPPPEGVAAEPGQGHVTVRWLPVHGAVGYLVHRAEDAGGPFTAVDHGGGDGSSVPDTWYTDTTGTPGTRYFYAVASVSEVTVIGPVGAPVEAASSATTEVPSVDFAVAAAKAAADAPLHRPWRPMIGSERLSQLRSTDTSGGRPIGVELLAALRRVHDELGVESVRAHAILHDDLGVYREVDGEPVHDFRGVDEVYDAVLGIGLRPVVEIGFMPRDLASGDATVFDYQGWIAPPKDWGRWRDLVTALVHHLVGRYGLDEVLGWYFEVWNEANLEVFWSGDRDEWMRLYDETAFAVRAVDERLRVGGPSSAASGWVDDLLDHVAESGAPLDFVSTHAYGIAPLDLRPTLERHGRGDAAILWTEWGVSPTHFNPVNDGVSAATFLLSGMRSAAGRVDALSYWVASDHFEELGRPPAFLHGGFGLITVGGIAKARYHALTLLERLGVHEVAVRASGDGAGGLVQAWASSHADGRRAVLVWNHTLDQSKADGEPTLARRVRVSFDGPVPDSATVTRLDQEHGDVSTLARRLGVADWPTDEQWTALRAADRLGTERVAVHGAVVELDLPQPGAVLIEL